MNIAGANKYSGKIWMNGEFIPAEDAKIHIITHSLHYAGAVYEGIKSYEGSIFKLEDHINRLFASAKAMMLDIHFTQEDICKAAKEIITINQLKNAYIRPLVWRGDNTTTRLLADVKHNIMIAATESAQINDHRNVRAIVGKWRKQSPYSAPSHAKSSSIYSMMLICALEAQQEGYDDALLLDDRGYIAEFTTSNVFFAKGKELWTPTTYSCIEGITRLTVIEMSRKLGFTVKELDIKLSDLHEFDTCFATGTAAGIKNVASITNGVEKILFQNHQLVDQFKQEYKNLVLS